MKTNQNIRKRGIAVLAAFGIVATALLSTASPASAQSALFCPTVERLSAQGLTQATINPSDSIATAVGKVDKVRNSWIAIRKVAPSDLVGDMTRMINNLATIKKSLIALKTQKGTKAAGTRTFIQQMLNNFQSDVLFLKLSFDDLCTGGGSPIEDEGDDFVPTPEPSPAPSSGGARLIPGSGIYEVGVDIAPGPYTTRGSSSCRAGQSDDITGTDITQGYVASIGTGVTTIQIDGSRRYFITRNCPDWRPGTRP